MNALVLNSSRAVRCYRILCEIYQERIDRIRTVLGRVMQREIVSVSLAEPPRRLNGGDPIILENGRPRLLIQVQTLACANNGEFDEAAVVTDALAAYLRRAGRELIACAKALEADIESHPREHEPLPRLDDVLKIGGNAVEQKAGAILYAAINAERGRAK